jgi:ABC-type multidrug transport system ATPase subunit
MGVAHIPSDRYKRAIIPTFSLENNLILGSEWRAPFTKNGIFARQAISSYAQRLIEHFQIRCGSSQDRIAELSGGNQQKAVIARELSHDPKVIIAAQPTRGLDVGAIEYIHRLLLDMRAQGKAILLITPKGYPSDEGAKLLLAKREKIINDIGLSDKKYVELRDYRMLTGVASKEARMVVSNFLLKEGLEGHLQ